MHSLALTAFDARDDDISGNAVWVWGLNDQGQLGLSGSHGDPNGDQAVVPVPQRQTVLSGAGVLQLAGV